MLTRLILTHLLFKPRYVTSTSLSSPIKKPETTIFALILSISLSLSLSLTFLNTPMLILDRKMMQGPRSPLITFSPCSPSFDSYSSGHNLADIASRVVQELSISDHQPPPTATTNIFSLNINNNNNNCEEQEHEHHHQQQEEREGEEEEEEFEFKFVYGPETEQTTPVSADDIFYNGKIMPVYPLFDTTLLHNNNGTQTGLLPTEATETPTKTVRVSLRKLFYQENLVSSSSSLSESDHQESYQDAGDGTKQLPPGTYCAWAPPKKGGEGKESGHSKMKSNSTGSSNKWKLRDLLYRRNNSDGKETFVFLARAGKRVHGSRGGGGGGERVERERRESCVKETKVGGLKQSCEKTGEVKRQSYLPNKKEMVGFFLMG